MVGNFPFIRQELIEKKVKGYKAKIEQVIKEDWLLDYPEVFKVSESNREAYFAALKDGRTGNLANVDFNLSGQADIYAYLFFHAGRFVKEGGRMGFITSNAWLDVAYGYELQKYMVSNFKIVAVLESRCEPWFEDAAVNTVVTILQRCSSKKDREDHIVNFVKVKKKLVDLIPWDPKTDTVNRWIGLDGFVQKIESASSRTCFDLASGKTTLEGIATCEDDDFRIRLVKQADLKTQLQKDPKTAKWGQYLRAPQVYFDLMKEHGDKFVPLREVADIRFGIKTGINDFFYLDEEAIQHWGIEEEFLVPVIKSPREISKITIKNKQTKYKLFICGLSKAELRKRNKFGALIYIDLGENQVTAGGMSWDKVPSVQGRQQWWTLADIKPADFFIIAFQNERSFFPVNKAGVCVSDVFFQGHIKGQFGKQMTQAWLNSSISLLLVQVFGRTGLGEGVLKLIGPEIDELLTIVKPMDSAVESQVIDAFNKLAQRAVKPISEEVKMKDRQEFDSLVLEALGIDPNKYMNPIYDGLTEMVNERIALANMRKNIKQSKPVRDTAKLLEQVTGDIVRNGLKKFPDDFLETKPRIGEYTDIAVPGSSLKLGHHFLGQQEVVGDDYCYQARSLEAARYIIYANRHGEYIVKLPNDDIAVNKAIVGYEHYLRELFQRVNTEILNRTFDHKLAESLSHRVFDELGLPAVNF